MQIIKVLSRRDAYSVLLAIVLAMAIQTLMGVAYFWASELLSSPGDEFGPPDAWKQVYGPSVIASLLQITAIEAFLWLVWAVNKILKPRRAKK